MAYCNYSFYKSEYYGNVIAEHDFPRLSSRAADMLDTLTFNRITCSCDDRYLYDNEIVLGEKEVAKIKKTVCRFAELFFDIESAEKTSREVSGTTDTEEGKRGKLISSVSSGSESISYSTNLNNSVINAILTDRKSQYRLFYDIAKEYLSGTGLLYAGF